jgi:hypothetical protein
MACKSPHARGWGFAKGNTIAFSWGADDLDGLDRDDFGVVGEAGIEPTTPGLEGLSGHFLARFLFWPTVLRFKDLHGDPASAFTPICPQGPHKSPQHVRGTMPSFHGLSNRFPRSARKPE